MHSDMWSHLNAIRHQDGCRLVHPAKWDISSMPYAIITDVDWYIPPSGTLDNFGVPSWRMAICASRQAVHSIYHSIHIYDGFCLMNPVFIIIHIHSVFKYHILIPYSLSYSHLSRISFDESRPYHHLHSFGFHISHFNSIFTFLFIFMTDSV